MKELNYSKIGLKCGIEIHQQLDTKKLFCRCPASITSKKDFEVFRFLRASQGETGEVDLAARAEAEKGRKTIYSGSSDNACLIDLDEEPPLPLNEEALDIVLMVAKMLNASVLDVVQVMRKVIVDGSNTSGFQRTALVALDGVIDSSLGRITIPMIALEEDSAQIRRRERSFTEFNLDRLGTPLIEINTGPQLKTPNHVKEVAEQLGLLLRSTGCVKRGLGTIRQDVNISIKGGTRVEIKGAQDLKLIPEIVRREIQRQQALIELKGWFKEKKVTLVKSLVDITDVVKETESKMLLSAIKAGALALCLCVKNAHGLIGAKVQPNRRLGTEISNYLKVATGIRGCVHSDELPKFGITKEDVQRIRKKLSCTKDDAFIFIVDSELAVRRGFEVIRERLELVEEGVLSEVRNALPDGSSEFLRPMPGAARMYPETDIPLVKINKKHLESVSLPEHISDRALRYEKHGVPKDLAFTAAKSSSCSLIDSLLEEVKKLKPSFFLELVLTAPRTIKKQFGVEASPSDKEYEAVILALDEGKIAKSSVFEILKSDNPITELKKFSLMSEKEAEAEVKKIVAKNENLPFNALIGEVMKVLRGKADGKLIAELVRKYAKN